MYGYGKTSNKSPPQTNIKQLLQYQFSNDKPPINDYKKYENSFLQEKINLKNGSLGPSHQNDLALNRNNSSMKNEKKNPIGTDKLSYPNTATNNLRTTRSISNNASSNTPKISNLVPNENKLFHSKDLKGYNNKKDYNPESKMTLSPSNGDRFNQYSPNKIHGNMTAFDFKTKNFSIFDSLTNKKENFLIQSLNINKSNFNLFENTGSNFNFVGSSAIKADSVKEYACKEEQNPRYRQSMEDFMKVTDRFNNDQNSGLFTLFDGHGGKDAALYSKEKFPEIFAKFLNQNNSPEKALILAFQKIDLDLKNRSIANENVGTTASVVYITKEVDIVCSSKRMLYVANVGDSRVLLLQYNGQKKISYDHRCTDINEINRVKQAGGIIFNCRVFGQLALTRAIGDHSLKKYGVISTPYTNKITLDDKDKYVIIASDGVWDSLTDQEVYKLSLTCNGSQELASSIVKSAITKGSKDNTSCIVIKLD